MALIRDLLSRWSAVTASHPRALLACAFLCNTLLTVFLFVHLDSFAFDEPLRGFESRGSSLADRINCWKLITGRTNSADDVITLYPRHSDHNTTLVLEKSDSITDAEEEAEKKRIAAARTEQQMRRDGTRKKNRSNGPASGFCGQLTDSYVQFVIEPQATSGDMFSLEYLQDTCELDRRLRSLEQFAGNCVTRDGEQFCCRSWSLPNLIARFANKTDCSNLTAIDVYAVREALDSCSDDYRRKMLHPDCFDDPKTCPHVPSQCYSQENLIFDLFHYILDGDFVDRDHVTTGKLSRSNIFLPVAKSSNLLPFFHELDSVLSSSSDMLVHITSFDVGLRDILFERLLLEDTKLLAIAYLTVLAIVWLYTKSFCIMILTSFNLIASLGAASALYKYLYGIQFFPFMNLMTIVLLIAVGTDSTFIFVQVWDREIGVKSTRPLEEHLNSFFKRTLMSTLLSNGTTCLALVATVISDITSLKCFSVFAATAILVLYLQTIITVPALLVLISNPARTSTESVPLSGFRRVCKRLLTASFKVLSSLRYFLTVAVIAGVVVSTVMLTQNFHLPHSEHFSIFHSNHPFETFDTKYRDLFKFSHRVSEEESSYGLPITIVFGIKAKDNGNYFDPFNRGSLQLDPAFDAASFQSQKWMLKLCQNLRNVSFYKPIHGPLLSNCFVETFKAWMEGRPCFDHIMNKSNSPCCNHAIFPYDRTTFDTCVPKAIDVFYRTPTFVISREGPGLRFSQSDSRLVAVIVQYSTNFTFTSSYVGMKAVVDQIEQWMGQVLADAPPGMQSGFFVSEHLELLALQQSLVTGTLSCIIVALLLAFFCILIATRSFMLTSVALLTIAAIITSTLATLVLVFQWQINVIESVAVLVAIGISVDLPLHYIIAFQRQDTENLSKRTLTSLSEVGTPLLAASLTTASAGLWMICSQILAYIRVGTFLLVISCFNVMLTFLLLTCFLLIVEKKTNSSSRQSQIEFLRNDLPLSDY